MARTGKRIKIQTDPLPKREGMEEAARVAEASIQEYAVPSDIRIEALREIAAAIRSRSREITSQ